MSGATQANLVHQRQPRVKKLDERWSQQQLPKFCELSESASTLRVSSRLQQSKLGVTTVQMCRATCFGVTRG